MAKKVKGTKLFSGETAIAKLYRIQPPGGKRETVDATTLEDDYKRKDPGEVIDSGNLTADLEVVDGLEDTLDTLLEAGENSEFSIVYADGRGKTFSGCLIEKTPAEMAEGGKRVIGVTFAVDGKPWNYGDENPNGQQQGQGQQQQVQEQQPQQ